MKFVSFLSLIIVVLCLTTCTGSGAEENQAITIGDQYLPSQTPDGSLFPYPYGPRPVDDYGEEGITVPLPSAGGLLEFIKTVLTGFIAFLLWQQKTIMKPPEPS